MPTSCDAAWDEAFREMMLAWHSSNDEVRADRLLAQLLTYKGLGIARVSKWLCFIDQSRFVIFDSRVSRALRCINIDGQRVFPIISGRVPKAGAEGWTAADISGKNLVSNALTVSTYRLYLRLVKMISGNRGLEPAKVEMGLFMMGKGFPPLTEPRLPFGRELHK